MARRPGASADHPEQHLPGGPRDLAASRRSFRFGLQFSDGSAAGSCTLSTDLAGIYFAVQASYEQQLVNTNQQALNTAVKLYRAAYQKELTKLSALLRTTKAVPFPKPPKAKT